MGDNRGEGDVKLLLPASSCNVASANFGAGDAINVDKPWDWAGVRWGVNNVVWVPTAGVTVSIRLRGLTTTGIGPVTSTFRVPSTPFSTAAVTVLPWSTLAASTRSPPVSIPGLSSYKTGENRIATLAFLCPGSWAIGGLAKFALE